jgi:hypothetical protein
VDVAYLATLLLKTLEFNLFVFGFLIKNFWNIVTYLWRLCFLIHCFKFWM